MYLNKQSVFILICLHFTIVIFTFFFSGPDPSGRPNILFFYVCAYICVCGSTFNFPVDSDFNSGQV